ncbi:MAG: M15 family metallopeptidase [Terrisporobacter othiniensis]|uniref:D-alanyl-D-alanine carboxypeptidase-like core domain-containing protein n=1 Tax=Terrisporobacter othiniensis TaxID=1577792 RepID=A0A0B3WU51_9FIRM|nr:M15 family metallopeptidase [Terrisporobacter othiniensis]KHS58110.1 hypothetical protein QX51_04875 [Terrisporobacter othiniensis]MDU6986275.1 M15 family metallopeptidase [Terrisporobacter othiniensis]
MNQKKVYSTIGVILLFGGFLLFCGAKNLTQAKELAAKNQVLDYDMSNYSDDTEVDSQLKNVQELVYKYKNGIAKLVNKENGLKSSYEPDDLVIPKVNTIKSDIYLSECASNNLEKMFKDAKEEGINLYLISGYRSSSYQEELYSNSLIRKGKEYTQKYVAKANQSEHQTGLAVDISSKSIGYKLIQSFEMTEEGKWLEKNAHKYGFILRYKKDRVEDTGYGFEPWHFRYVGHNIAKYIYENDLILEDLYKLP